MFGAPGPQHKAWFLGGNDGTDPTVDFLGTTDATDLVIRTDDLERIRVLASGHTRIGDAGVDFLQGVGTLDVTPLIDDIPGGSVVQAIGTLLTPTLEYTAQLTGGLGGQMIGTSMGVICRPASGLGGGTDATVVTALAAASTWDGSNSPGRTVTSLQGATVQAAVRGGTATDLVAIQSQGGTVLGGSAAISAISIRANAPFEFLGGSIVTGISFVSIGSTVATTNWNAQFRGSNSPSYFEGQTSFGHTNAPNYIIDTTFARIRGTGFLAFGGTTVANEFELSSPATDIFRIESAGGETLDFDASNAGITEITSSGSDEIHFNYDQVAFGSDSFGGGNGIFKFTAPARSPNINGGYSDMFFTASANIDLTGATMSEVVTMSMPTPSITLGGGTVTNTAALLLGGNAGTAGTNNYILWQQGTVGVNLFNAESQFTNDFAHSGTNWGIFSTTPTTQPADPVALTDSTGGTANNTVAAVSGSGDDATINDNFADLTAKYNALRTGLRSLGIFA